MTLTEKLLQLAEEKMNDETFRKRLNSTVLQPYFNSLTSDTTRIRSLLLHFLWPLLAMQVGTLVLVLALVILLVVQRR